ncbi:MAG TPA: IS1 family transposase [Rhizomicrobium sp.]|nr:IS1 family transposase [Rhizomicrobium sp.]
MIAALCEGVSIRATERLTGIHRDTVMRLGVKVGQGCNALHGKLMVNLHCSRVELDEVWSFVKKKRRNIKADDPDTIGDQFVFIAMDSTSKAIISWMVGKRSTRNTIDFVRDVRHRILGNPEISTDGYAPYIRAVDEAFNGAGIHGIVDKQEIIIAKGPDADRYYAKQVLMKVERTAISGDPRHISTSYIERQNLTLRMSQRRMTRLSNGFSKKYENHCAAVALYAMHYNFCRVHEALRVTPAMQLGLADHVWTTRELAHSATTGAIQEKVRSELARFRVIEGGKSD